VAREKVEFPFNETQFVRLEYADGKESQGRNGVEYQYFLGDDKIMWAPLEVRQQLREIGIGAQDEAAITRHKNGGAASWWTVEHVMEEPDMEGHTQAFHQPPPPPAQPPIRAVPPRAPAAAPAARRSRTKLSAARQLTPEEAAALGLTAADLPAKQAQLDASNAAMAESQLTGQALSMCSALKSAIDEAAEASKYAQRIGFRLVFKGRDIRAMANGMQMAAGR